MNTFLDFEHLMNFFSFLTNTFTFFFLNFEHFLYFSNFFTCILPSPLRSVVLLGVHVGDALALAWTVLAEFHLSSGQGGSPGRESLEGHVRFLGRVASDENFGKRSATRPFDVRFLGSEDDRELTHMLCKRPQDIKPAPRARGLSSGTSGLSFYMC